MRQQLVEIRLRADLRLVHREQVVADLDLPGDRRRAERNDLGDAQPPGLFVLGPIEAQPETSDGRAVTARAAAPAAGGHAHVRRVELADHQIQQPAHLGWRLRAGDEGRVLRAHRVPIHAVELVVVEAVAHVGPRLAEDLHLLLREVDVELGGDGDWPGHTCLDRHHRDAALFEVEDLAAVGRELRVGLGARTSTSTAARRRGSRASSSSE